MLENILTTISRKSEDRVRAILVEKGKAILTLKEEFKNGLAEKKNKEKIALKEVTVRELHEFKQAQELKVQFSLEELRSQMSQEVFKEAIKAVGNLKNNDFKKVIENLFKVIPQNKEGVFLAGSKTAAILNILLPDGVKAKADLDEEGFIFQTEEMDIDLRISQVIDQLKETVGPVVIQTLFKEGD